MIARVAIDSVALLDFKGEPRRAANTHSGIIEVLDEYGYLDLLGARDAGALFDAIQELNPDLRNLWSQALQDLHTLNRLHVGDRQAAMSDLCIADDLPIELGSLLDLVVVRESLASLRGIPAGTGFARRATEPELSLPDSVRRSSTIKCLRRQRVRGSFAKGESRETVWREVLARPAALSKSATILDRYFLTDLLASKGTPNRDHHAWLLRNLSQAMQQGSSICVLSELPVIDKRAAGQPPRMAAKDAERILRRALGPLVGKGNINECHIILAPWPPRWEDGPHNRHIRFSCGVALCASEGLDYLDRSQLLSPFTWQAATSADWIGELSLAEQVIRRAKRRFELSLHGEPAV